MKLIIGLTGPTGSGKTTALKVAEEKGFLCIDCDKVAHSVTQNNKLCFEALVNAFGGDIAEKGVLNRKILAAKAFSSKENTLLLNETVLPFIAGEILFIIENAAEDKILLDAPTLFESGLNEICNSVVSVLCNREIRKQRIMARDNISSDAAESRINAGKNDDFYKENSDYLFYNENSEEDFKQQISNCLDILMEE